MVTRIKYLILQSISGVNRNQQQQQQFIAYGNDIMWGKAAVVV